MRIVLTGAAGRLGAAMSAEAASAGHKVVALTRADLDISDAGRVASAMDRLRPDVMVNCSAYNAVDAAEANPAAAFATNVQGPSCLARAAQATGALLVHYSTDFVFDGTALDPYVEDHPTNPLSVYGASKLAGEVEARSTPRHYVLRIESLFGGCGVKGQRATVDHIVDKLLAGTEVRALVDRTVSPSYVVDVVRATIALIDRQASYGIYHCVNSGWSTWYELACEVARQLGVPARIEPAMTTDLKMVAPRPLFCALSNRKLLAVDIDMPSWQSAIGRHLAARLAQIPA
jgi:dTDP-4-dehydrorhamnose reductase